MYKSPSGSLVPCEGTTVDPAGKCGGVGPVGVGGGGGVGAGPSASPSYSSSAENKCNIVKVLGSARVN